ncbi:MAG: gamma-glutamyl-gamma-aminobutyrate hydrolase family protein, partial [Polyangiaceae bacterium]|nr:gamma-glutamyl-gamma-aminobutyrate hydrolase family protein [Polyangiaceae bacterium]
RKWRIPFLGICLGMQLAVVEFARNILDMPDANSTEFDENTSHPVIDLMPDQRDIKEKGGTMRLGAFPCKLLESSLAALVYGQPEVKERHRHRYEFANEYRDAMTRGGMVLSGTSPDGRLVEMIELPEHPYFVGCQFHPEFRSKIMAPHPLFASFVKAAMVARRNPPPRDVAAYRPGGSSAS